MSYISDLISRYPALSVCEADIENACDVLQKCFASGGKVLLAGNGGSAADSDHITGELLKSFVLPRKIDSDFLADLEKIGSEYASYMKDKLEMALPAISLPSNTAAITANANDTDAALIFAQQIMGLGNKGDVYFAISTSGNSKNILFGAAVAKAKGLKIISLTGRDGGKLKNLSDVAIIAPEKETYKIQEFHLPIYHALCMEIEERFFGEKSK